MKDESIKMAWNPNDMKDTTKWKEHERQKKRPTGEDKMKRRQKKTKLNYAKDATGRK